MTKKLVSITAVLALTMFGSMAHARKALDFSIHQDYLSTRAIGMGNAFTAVADDHNAIFYNPAALAKREDGQMRFFLRAGIDANYLEFMDDVDQASQDESNEEQAIIDVLEKNYGEHLYSRVPTLGFMWARPNWGIAFLPADLTVDMVPHKSGGGSLSLNAFMDSTLAYSYARDVDWAGSHDLSLGVTVKGIHRAQVSKNVLAAELIDGADPFTEEDAAEGFTVDADIGVLFTPDLPKSGMLSWFEFLKPSFALTVRNAIDHGFPMRFDVLNDLDETPDDLQRRVDLGTKWKLPDLWVFDTKFAFDLRDMTHENWDWKQGTHAGFEAYWTMFSWWRGHWSVGVNQGYPTAGFGAKFGVFNIDLATYGSEVGTKDATKESRRYLVELSLDF